MNHHKRLPACLHFIPFCLTIFLLFSFSGTSAEPKGTCAIPVTDTLPTADSAVHIYDANDVDIEASFKGGLPGWWKFLERNLNGNIPADKGAPQGQYFVVIQFVVNTDGTLSDIKPLTTHGFGMEEEVVRILRKSPRWEPAMKNGRSVAAYRKQPVTFQISVEADPKKKKKG